MEMNIQGNIVPAMWYYTVVNDSGKSYMLAIAILADIVSGYQIREKRDDTTGAVIQFEKTPSDEILKRSYLYYQELLNEKHKNVQRAMAFLEKKGIIQRIYRTVQGADGRFKGSMLLLQINLDVLYDITYPMELPKRIIKEKKITRKREKRGGQKCSNGEKSTKGRTGHQCPRCTRCPYILQICENEPILKSELDELEDINWDELLIDEWSQEEMENYEFY